MINENEKKRDAFSLESTNCAKGIFAVLVVLCHIWGRADVSADGFVLHNLGRLLSIFGYISVSMFFFFSGYGLWLQYKTKGDEYVKRFLRRNVLSLYLINVIFIIAYTLFLWGVNGSISLGKVLQSFFFGSTIIVNGWFLQACLLYYLAYYFIFRFIKKDTIKLISMAVFLFGYCLLCALALKLPITWYECSFTFLFGMIFCKHKEKVEKIIYSAFSYLIALGVMLAIFLVTCYIGSSRSNALGQVLKIISAVAFCAVAVLLLSKISVNNCITRWLGNLYLEIYLMQGFFLVLYKTSFLYIENVWLYAVLVLASTLLSAALIHPLSQRLLKALKKNA